MTIQKTATITITTTITANYNNSLTRWFYNAKKPWLAPMSTTTPSLLPAIRRNVRACVRACACVCTCAGASASASACVLVLACQCTRACVHVCVRACVRARACLHGGVTMLLVDEPDDMVEQLRRVHLLCHVSNMHSRGGRAWVAPPTSRASEYRARTKHPNRQRTKHPNRQRTKHPNRQNLNISKHANM